MFSRVLVEVAAINRALFTVVWIPIVSAGAIALIYSVYLYLSQRSVEEGEIPLSNPFEIGPAVKFGFLYAAILIISRTAQIYFGDAGIFASSIISGLADVDAITLSMAELSHGSEGIALSTASQAIVLAAMSNTVVKGGIVLMMGSRALRKALLPFGGQLLCVNKRSVVIVGLPGRGNSLQTPGGMASGGPHFRLFQRHNPAGFYLSL